VKAFDEEAVVALGKEQVEALFRRQETPGQTLDDRDFIPLLEAVVSAFGTMGLSAAGAEAIEVLSRVVDEDFVRRRLLA
jgi:hypothetical protein